MTFAQHLIPTEVRVQLLSWMKFSFYQLMPLAPYIKSSALLKVNNNNNNIDSNLESMHVPDVRSMVCLTYTFLLLSLIQTSTDQ